MNERSNLISKLQSDLGARRAYIQSKVGTLVPSQIRALRLKSSTPRQPDLARAAEMQQSRISMLETAGANPTLGTLSAIAAALNVGLKVEFVPFSEMLAWENCYSQDEFKVTQLENDTAFINPSVGIQPTHMITNMPIWGTFVGAFVGLKTASARDEAPIQLQAKMISSEPSIDERELVGETTYQTIPATESGINYSYSASAPF